MARHNPYRTAVYRLFREDGRLLYVGMGSPRDRLLMHARKKEWWPDVDPTRTTITWYDNRAAARAAESRAIRAEDPIHNVLGTPRHALVMVQVRRRMNSQPPAALSARAPQPFQTKHVAGTFEISRRLGVSRQRVGQLTARADWPAPLIELAMGKVWRIQDIEAWVREHRPELGESTEGQPAR